MPHLVKNWTFNTVALAGLACSAFAVLLLVVNAATGNRFLAVLLPVAVLALLAGGILSVRARLLRFRGRSNPPK